MHDSQRYRDSAAACLLAARDAFEPHYRKLHLSMAASWLSLARQDEAMEDLLVISNTAGRTTAETGADNERVQLFQHPRAASFPACPGGK